MTPIIFFPGKHNIDILGATRVIAYNLFPMTSQGSGGSIIGMGYLKEYEYGASKLTQIDIRPEYLRKALPYRMIGKANLSIRKSSQFNSVVSNWVQSRLDILADSLAAEKVKILFQNGK